MSSDSEDGNSPTIHAHLLSFLVADLFEDASLDRPLIPVPLIPMIDLPPSSSPLHFDALPVVAGVSYDRTLPASHAYLGEDLEDVGGGACMFEARSVQDGVPLFPLPHLILMPGQTLPLQSLHPRAISMFRAIIAQSKVFGVVSMR